VRVQTGASTDPDYEKWGQDPLAEELYETTVHVGERIFSGKNISVKMSNLSFIYSLTTIVTGGRSQKTEAYCG